MASGLIQGQIFFYEYEGLKYKTQMDCRNRSGKYKKGTKVTGLCFQYKKEHYKALQANADLKEDGYNSNTLSYGTRRKMSTAVPPQLLVSTNDSRIRYCKLEDYSITTKFKGLINKSMQIKASFSDDGKYVISGSEDGNVFIWRTASDDHNKKFAMFKSNEAFKNSFYESFVGAKETCATVSAIFAPAEAVRHFVRAQDSFLQSLEQLEPDSSSAGKSSPVPMEMNRSNTAQSRSSMVSEHLLEVQDMSSRAIATSDTEGRIRIFFRLS